jgi:hypothetical protein
MEYNDLATVPTHPRGLSTIDYIYLGQGLTNGQKDAHIVPMKPDWSDHSALEILLQVGKSQSGPGLWRGNPAYAKEKPFKKMLKTRITTMMDNMDDKVTPQQQWE